MSLAALERLEDCQRHLIAALDGHDVERLETSVLDLHDAVGHARAAGAWQNTPDILARARRIVALADAARVRVNFLTDITQRRIDGLVVARGGVPASTYSRRGRTIA